MERLEYEITREFPSPYGLIFILTRLNKNILEVLNMKVSVSLRSIIHSYEL